MPPAIDESNPIYTYVVDGSIACANFICFMSRSWSYICPFVVVTLPYLMLYYIFGSHITRWTNRVCPSVWTISHHNMMRNDDNYDYSGQVRRLGVVLKSCTSVCNYKCSTCCVRMFFTHKLFPPSVVFAQATTLVSHCLSSTCRSSWQIYYFVHMWMKFDDKLHVSVLSMIDIDVIFPYVLSWICCIYFCIWVCCPSILVWC